MLGVSNVTCSSFGKRIAIVAPSLAGQGAERKALYIAAGLLERGHQVDLLLYQHVCHYPEEVPDGVRIFYASGRNDSRTRLNLDRVTAIQRPFVPNPLPWHIRLPRLLTASRLSRKHLLLLTSTRLPRWAVCIAAYMDLEKPDALLAMHVLATTAAAMATHLTSHKAKTVASLHGPITRQLLHRACRSYPYADEVVGVSHGITSEFSKIPSLPADRVHTVYNPIGIDYIKRKSKEPISHRWLAGPDCPVIVAIGKLIKRKDFATLLRAFARLVSKRNARLIVLGEGRFRSDLLSLANRLGLAECVDFPGFAENPFAFLSKADLFVLSSRNEGLPTVLIEAMVCGCPVVSTDCDFGPREILEDGRHGPLVPVGEPETLASAMLSVLDNPPQREALQARAEFFNAAKAVDQYEELLLGEERSVEQRA